MNLAVIVILTDVGPRAGCCAVASTINLTHETVSPLPRKTSICSDSRCRRAARDGKEGHSLLHVECLLKSLRCNQDYNPVVRVIRIFEPSNMQSLRLVPTIRNALDPDRSSRVTYPECSDG